MPTPCAVTPPVTAMLATLSGEVCVKSTPPFSGLRSGAPANRRGAALRSRRRDAGDRRAVGSRAGLPRPASAQAHPRSRDLETFSVEDADAYLHNWNCVGHVPGIDDRLICDSIDEGRALWRRISARNWEACPEGRAMTKALIEAMEHVDAGLGVRRLRVLRRAFSAGTSSATSLACGRTTGRRCSAGRCAGSPATRISPATSCRGSPPSRVTSAGSCSRASAGPPAAGAGALRDPRGARRALERAHAARAG